MQSRQGRRRGRRNGRFEGNKRGEGFRVRTARRRCMLGECDRGLLSELCIGQKARVVNLNCHDPALRRRLIDMGITEGVELCVKKVAPFGCPVDISLRGYELCLRRRELEKIEIEVIS